MVLSRMIIMVIFTPLGVTRFQNINPTLHCRHVIVISHRMRYNAMLSIDISTRKIIVSCMWQAFVNGTLRRVLNTDNGN